MKKFRVAYNTHRYHDTSDTCRLQFRNVTVMAVRA